MVVTHGSSSSVRAPTCGAAVRRVAACLMAALLASAAIAQPGASEAAVEAARPRIALVLSGGGARGFAHVGVLRALQDMRVPIDIVVGASMGAVVGGAYAAGRSVEDMERFVRETDWSEIMADRPPRDALAGRRREDDLLLPSRIEFSIGRSGMRLPLAAAGNVALESALTRLLPPGTANQRVDRLALPFRSVASDLLSGELVELSDTPLFMSIRASLAVPGVFAPVRLNGRLVVDGGLVRNLPVDMARAMGADVVIAVNVGTHLADESELNSAIDVARQMMLILTEQNVQRSLKELGPRDVLIAPDLQGVSFLNFGQGERAMAAGEQAARRVAPRLAGFALAPEAYAAFESARAGARAPADVALPLASVDVQPTPHAGRQALAAQFGLQVGDRATLAQIQAAASHLRNRAEFASVEVLVDDTAGRRNVTVTPVEAEGERSRLRLGLEVVSDFADDNRFTLSALHTLSWLNSWGAELRTLGRIGSQRLLLTQLWQPLAPGSDWYFAPSVQYNASSVDVYQQGRRSLRLGYSVTTATVALGREFSNWGQVQVGVDRRVGRSESLIPSDGSADARFRETASYLQVQIDTLDSLALPSRGTLLQSRFEKASAEAGAPSRSTSSIIGLQAFRVADWAGHFYAEWSKARGGLAPLSLGGFLRLSGTQRDSVGGRAVALGRLVMARRIGEMPAGLGGAVRAGYSLELGAGYEPDETALRSADFKHAGSAFVSVDTRFGPLFLAAGATRGGSSTVYLFIGPFW